MSDVQNPPTNQPNPAPEIQEPTWLKPRLESAERAAEKKILDRLGITDVDAASKAIAAANAAAEANKTAAEKAAELQQQLNASKSEAERLGATTKEFAARMMMALTAEQQAAVKAVAGEDSAKQLQTITAMAPTWAKQEPAKPVNTAPVGGPPSDPTSPPDHRSTYHSLKSTNPFAAAVHGLTHADEVFKPKS